MISAPMSLVWGIDIIGSSLMILLSLYAVKLSRDIYKKGGGVSLFLYLYAQTIALAIFAFSRSFGHIIKRILITLNHPEVWQALSPVSGSINSLSFVVFGFSAMLYSDVRAASEKVDILEREKRKLRKSEKKFRTLFDSASDAIFINESDSLEGCFLEVNQMACESLGYSREELLQMTMMEINTKEYAALVPERNEELRQRGHIFFESAHLRRDGSVILVELSSRIIEYDGKSAVLSIARDITKRKKIEERLEQSLERLRTAMQGTIQAIALTAEMRDPYTAGHQHRVAKLAQAIAVEMGLPEKQIEGIQLAALIHDLGKIYVPAEILSKPGRLTEVEFNMIKTHPQVGYDILKTIKFPWPVAQIVHQHHERMDGSGYPSGLSGEDIILEARILGVADVIEAMASHRPYRPAVGIDKALEEISKNRGILYDTQVVDICLDLFNKKRFKFES